DDATTLTDGSHYESAGQRRNHQQIHRHGPRGFPGDRDLRRIATEGRDVVVNPLQCGDLIEQPVVAGRMMRGLGGQLRMREEAEDSQAVVRGDYDHAPARHVLAVIPELRRVPRDVPTAVEVEQNGELGFPVRGCPDVEGQPVFAEAGGPELHVLKDVLLHAARTESRPVFHAFPRNHGLRGPPPEIADRWSGERDTPELTNARRGDHARDSSAGDGDGRRLGQGQQESDQVSFTRSIRTAASTKDTPPMTIAYIASPPNT